MNDALPKKIQTLLEAARRLQDHIEAGGVVADPSARDAFMQKLTSICFNLHHEFLERRDFPAAHEVLEQFIAIDPGNAMIRKALAESYQKANNPFLAAGHFARLLADQPDNGALAFALGGCQLAAGQRKAALATFEIAATLMPDNIQVANNLANLLIENGDLQRAIKIIDAALQTAPKNPSLLRSRGMACQDLGDMAGAKAAFQALVAVDPDNAEAHRLLSLLTSYRDGDPHIAAMERTYQAAATDSARRIPLGFGLFRAYHATGRYPQAIEHLLEANTLKRQTYDFDMAAQRQRLIEIEERYSPEFCDAHRDAGDPDRAPVFIVGMPRSGTTLAEQIVASHPDVHGAGERDLLHALHRPFYRAYFEQSAEEGEKSGRRNIADYGSHYLSALRALSGDAKFHTDKMPVNFMLIGFIRLILPNARIIHCRREPVANCFALYSSFLPARSQAYTFDINEIATYYIAYHRLMSHWKNLFGDAIHDLSYEALLADQEGETRKLLDYVGLDFDPACLNFHQTDRAVRTLSSAQVRTALYSGANDRVQHYKHFLAPLIQRLEDAGVAVPVSLRPSP